MNNIKHHSSNKGNGCAECDKLPSTVPWFNQIKTDLSKLAEDFDLDPIQAEHFRETMFGLLKREYMKGNKSGIAWAFKKAHEKQNQ